MLAACSSRSPSLARTGSRTLHASRPGDRSRSRASARPPARRGDPRRLRADVVSSFGSQNLAGQLPDYVRRRCRRSSRCSPCRRLWILFAISRGYPAELSPPRRPRCRVRSLRQGALTPVPDLADPARGAGCRGLGAVAAGLFVLALVLTQLWFPRTLLRGLLTFDAGPGLAARSPEIPPSSRSRQCSRSRSAPGGGSYGAPGHPRAGRDVSAVPALSRPRPAPSRTRSHARRRRTSTSAPSIRTSPSAGWNRTGRPVRMRSMASSARTPMTESCGPVIPASVNAAVPPGSTRGVVRLDVGVGPDHGRGLCRRAGWRARSSRSSPRRGSRRRRRRRVRSSSTSCSATENGCACDSMNSPP